MADNNDIPNKENHLSNAESTQQNDKGGVRSFEKFKEWLSRVWKEYPRIATSVGAVILGFLAFWEGYGQFWFGYQLSAWILITIAVALNVVWLMAVCGYLSDREKKKKIKLFSWNTLLMITLPVLVLGILLGYFTMRWRLADKIVILVEPFVDVGELQDDSASGKDPEGIAEIVKSCLENAIPLRKRLKVRVVLGKRHEKGNGEEMPLDERALKYRADMVISGWYVERDKEFLVCPKFQVFRAPKPLPAAFMQSGGTYPKSIIFSSKEIENFDVNLTLGNLLTYEATLVLGAGAYASGDWKTAQHFFGKALQKIEKLKSPEKGSRTKVEPPEKKSEAKKNSDSSIEHENLRGDEALLQLYMGHCLMNQSEFENAILRYDDAIEAGKKMPPSDMRYGEILASAYLARGVAYRRMNAFELAGRDFETAGGHLPTSFGPKPPLAEDARFLSEDREKLKIGARKYCHQGEKYLIQREYKHAQAYLEMSVEFYRTLMRGMPTPIQEKHSLALAKSLTRLGEIHNRLAWPELKDDEHTGQAILYLKEAYDITIELEGKGVSDCNNSVLELRADCLRYLGEAHRAQDQPKVVEKGTRHHQEARDIWLNLKDPNKSAEEQARIASKAAEEQTRIGNVYRRLNDLDPGKEWSKKAIRAYDEAVKMWMDEYKYGNLFSDFFGSQNDVNQATQALLTKVVENITAHHLASSLLTLADAHINQLDPNEQDIKISCNLLKFATECYDMAHKKLDIDECSEWIGKVRNEERNFSLKDDLAWCLTLYGYALTKQAIKDPNDIEIYKQANSKLEKAREYHRELRDKDDTNLVLNLFALSLTEHKLGGDRNRRKAKGTFREACLLLRDLTRREKKVWYLDHVCTILGELKDDSEFLVMKTPDDQKKEFKDLKNWLISEPVQRGRRALDKIIEGIERKIEEGWEN